MRLRPSRVFKYKKSLITIMVIVVAVGITVLIVKNLEAPAVGSVSQTPANKAEVIDPLSKPGQYNGKYISFPYPPHYKSTPTTLTGQNLEMVSYHFVGVDSRQINVGVHPGTLDTDGSINFRRVHPELYHKKFSAQWTEYTKVDGSEDVFFLGHNGMVAIISAVGSTAVTDNDALFVASGLRWH